MVKQERIESYLSNSYKPDYDPEEQGTWDVYGEDPNCDLGGQHHQPFLGRYEGRFIDVLAKATSLRGFYTWGGGGTIKKHNPVKVKKLKKGGHCIPELQETYSQKKAQLKEPYSLMILLFRK